MKALHVTLVLFLTLSSQIIFSQDDSYTTFNLKREISIYDEDSKTRDINIEVSKKTLRFDFNIICNLDFGHLTIEIYDPKGMKRSEFTVENQVKKTPPLNTGPTREKVQGQVSKSFNSPVKGNWKIKLISKKAYVKVDINSVFYIKE